MEEKKKKKIQINPATIGIVVIILVAAILVGINLFEKNPALSVDLSKYDSKSVDNDMFNDLFILCEYTSATYSDMEVACMLNAQEDGFTYGQMEEIDGLYATDGKLTIVMEFSQKDKDRIQKFYVYTYQSNDNGAVASFSHGVMKPTIQYAIQETTSSSPKDLKSKEQFIQLVNKCLDTEQ